MAGAPRTISPPPEECIRLGVDLIQWLTEKTKEPRLLLGQWWSIKQKMLRSQWNALKQKSEFVPYYEQAQQFMALKCLDGTIKEGFAQRYLRLYDRELRDEENEKAKFEAELKKVSNEILEPINQALISEQHNNIRLQNRINELEAALNERERKASEELLGSKSPL